MKTSQPGSTFDKINGQALERAPAPARASAESAAPQDPMDAERLMRFFADVGFAVHRSASAYWYEAGPRFLLSLPSHTPIELPEAEAREVLRATGAAGLRYVAASAAGARASFQMVAAGRDYGLERLAGNTRSKIRRGLKRHEIRRISGTELETAGMQAFVETLDRQDRRNASSIEQWKRLLAAADGEPGVEIWSAWQGHELAAYLMVFLIDDVCEFYQGRSRNCFLKDYPNNALVFHLTEEMLARRGLREVTYGLESLETVDSVDAFKLSMGYERKPIHQRIVFRPSLAAALKVPLVRPLIRWMGTRPQAASFWRKAYGLLAFAGGDESAT